MLAKLKKMKLIDWVHLLIIFFCYIPSLIIKFIYRNIWIVSENGNDAKDNGYAFFIYMMKNHPKIKCFYVIDKHTRDYSKLKKYKKNLLSHNSIKAIIYTMACKNYVSSQLASSFPYSNVFFNLYMLNIFNFNYTFLQHGITKENVECFYKKESNISLFCCAANPEYDYIKKLFGYKDYEVSKTGFCRYDNLNNDLTDSNYILYMPTWRKYLEVHGHTVTKAEEKVFLNSNYYKYINRLISDPKVIDMLEKNNKIMYFCLHDKALAYKKYFKPKSNNIKIVDKNSKETIDVLIKKCAYLITDTSSVAFDFAYLGKRVLYYQFDYDEIVTNHWGKGYFDYKNNGFGKVITSHNECVHEISLAIKNDFKNEKRYIDRVNNFYCFHDDKNCERTFNEINKVSEIKDKKSQSIVNNNIKRISPIVLIVSFLMVLFGYIFNIFNIMLLAGVLLFILNIYVSFSNVRRNIVFLLFNISIFTFLMAKPIIQAFRGIEWWSLFTYYSQKMSLLSIWLTLFGIFIGFYIYNEKSKFSISIIKNNWFNKYSAYIEKYAFIMFMITIIFKYICELEKLIFMQGKDYTEYYLTYHSELPSIVNYIGGMAITFMIVYLICLPKKRRTYLTMILYCLSMVPSFLIGQRNPLVLSVLFAFIYFVIRDYYENTDNWINYKIRICIIILIPILIIGLDIHNYARSNEEINGSIGEAFVDFFYTQGVSYDVLNIGYNEMDIIRARNKNYVIGPIYDYFQDNTIAKKVFHLKGLGNGNNVTRALEGNSFTHILAYLSRDDYLEGHGYGSSYVLELFCNYSFIGIFIFSTLLGYLFSAIPTILKKKNFLSIIVLYMVTTLLFLPRAETTSSIMFLFTPHFWGALVLLYIVVMLVMKYGEKNAN